MMRKIGPMSSAFFRALAPVVALGLAAFPFASGMAHADGSLAGEIRVTDTRLKTEGGKSDKEIVLFLERTDGGEYPEPPAEHVNIDQIGSVFVPHVLAVQQGTTVDFLNSDSFDHNVFSVDECCEIDLGNFPGGAKGSYTFDKTGEGVMLCKLHPEMAVYVVVLDTPYFITVDVDGSTQTASYSIEGVPAGDYTLKVWNKRTESLPQTVSIVDGQEARADVSLQKKQRKRKKKAQGTVTHAPRWERPL